LNENREWYKIRSSPSTTTSPKSSPNLAALRRVSLQLESGHGAVQDSSSLQARGGEERRNSDSSLLKGPNDQVLKKVQKRLQEVADCRIEENSSVQMVETGESRTARGAPNGTVINNSGAVVNQTSQQKDGINSCVSAVKGSSAN